MSAFAFTGKAKEDNGADDLPFDEGKMEQAMNMLASEAESINEDNPREAANLVRKLTDMTGLELGKGMNEALSRMENGEDPEKIEAEMGDLLDGEEPFLMPGTRAKMKKRNKIEPLRDDNLYDL